MKGRVLLSAVLLAVIGTHANASSDASLNGVAWTGGGAGAITPHSFTNDASLGEGAAARLAGMGSAVSLQPGTASGLSSVDDWLPVSDESGLAPGGILESIRTAVPIPAAAWWFGSALMGLTIVARRRDGRRTSGD